MIGEKKLSVQLLGLPLITWGEHTLTIPRKQARLILYFLACHKSMVARHDLGLVFWPESANSRQQLRDHLSKLRAELPDPEILQTDRDWIGLNYDLVNSDVITFEDNYDQVSLPFLSNANRTLPEAIYRKILASVTMWKAPQFMHGVGVLDSEELNEWIEEKNRKLRFKWLNMMLRISQHLMMVGDLDGALDWLDKISENDEDYNFPQAIYLRLEVLYKLGQYGKAYEFGQTIIDETDTEWFAEYKLPFETLMQKIKTERNLTGVRENPLARTENGRVIPLIGHKEVLTQMLQAFHRGNVIYLTGETGMGKTRLLHEFINRLTIPIAVLSMEAVYSEQDIPFHPFIEMLRRSMNMNDWQKVENFWLAQLFPFFPELDHLVGKRSEVLDVFENQRLSLYESFRQVLLTFNGKNKILVVIENSQWCDEESIRLFAYLAQRRFFLENAYLVMLSNYHQEIRFSIDYREYPLWIEQVAWIKIPPLSLEDVSNFGLYLMRTPITEQQAQKLLEATGGNPLFVIETLQMLLAKPEELAKDQWDQIPISGVVHLVLRERLQHLTNYARRVLNSAAIVGVEFSFEYVQIMLDIPELDLVNAFDELVDQEYIDLISQSQQPLGYRFQLTLLRDMLLQEMSATEKQVYHTHLSTYFLQLLEGDLPVNQVAEAAHHLGQAGYLQKAFSCWIQAATLYANSEDFVNANKAFKNALQLSQNRDFNMTEQQLFDLWIGWGEQALAENDYQKSNEYFQHALQEGLKRNSSLLIGSGLSGQSFLYLMRGLPAQARQYVDRAMTLLKDGSVLAFIRAGIRKMLISLYYFNLAESEAAFEEFAWLEDQLKTPKEEIAFANARNTLALTKALGSKFHEVDPLIEKANPIADKYRSFSLRMRNEFAMGLSYYYQGMYEKALDHMGIALNIAENNYSWRFVVETLSVTSHIHLAKGKTYSSFECIQNALNLAKGYQFTGLHSVLIYAEGKIHLAFGNYQQAVKLFDEALRFVTHDRGVLINQSWRLFAKALLGEHEEGIRQIEKIRLDAIKRQWIEAWIKASTHLGLILYLSGKIEDSLKVLQEVGQKAEELGFAAAGTAFAYVKAQEAIRQSDFLAAREYGTSILVKAEKEKSLWLQWIALDILINSVAAEDEKCVKYKTKIKSVVREINQSKPHWIEFEVNQKKPPLFGLV